MHTKGPLEVSNAGHGSKEGIVLDEYFIRVPGDDVSLAADIIDPETGKPSEANARRLVACWNACEGISTAVLEKGRVSPDAFQLEESRADIAEQHREELVAVLESLLAVSSVFVGAIFVRGFDLNCEEWAEKARAAIAKARGDE